MDEHVSPVSTPRVPEELRGVAEHAVERFLAEDASLELLGHGESVTWRVSAPSGRYLLRLHSPISPPAEPGFFTTRAIESECAWLQALADETDLVVQTPVPSPRGGCVLAVPRSDVGDTVPCTLLTWIEGERLEGKPTARQAARLGELLAKLQEHARRWARPPGFERPTHERTWWRRALGRIDQLVASGVVTAANRALLGRAVEVLDRELAPLANEPDRAGLVHADLHAGNYLFHEGFPRPLDFGRACFAPWLYDVAECAGHLGPGRRRDLVDAYAALRPFEDGDVRRLEGWFVGALVEVFGHHAPDRHMHGYLARAVPAWAPHVRRYLDGVPFLFEL